MLPEKLACIRNSRLLGSSRVAKIYIERERERERKKITWHMIICPDLWGENGQGKSSQIDDVMFNKVRSSKRKKLFFGRNATQVLELWVG